MKPFFFATAMLIVASATAVSVSGASLTVTTERYLATPVHQTEYAGPITLANSGRGGSLSATADYGRLKTVANQKVFSTVDGSHNSLATSFSEAQASFYDQFSVHLKGGLTTALILFKFDISSALTAKTSGFANAAGKSFAQWEVDILDGPNFQYLGLQGNYRVDDKPSGPPVASYDTQVLLGGLGGGGTLPGGSGIPGTQSIIFGIYMTSDRVYDITGATRCGAVLQSYRIADAVGTTCALGLTWTGLYGITGPDGSGLDPSQYDYFAGPSGYDYTQPYYPAVALRSGLDIAAVPEPASWALMIAGFGVVGGALRTRRAAAA